MAAPRSNIEKQLAKLTNRFLPPSAAQAAKRIAVYPRFIVQARECRKNYQQYNNHYPQKILFVAGLPKSGTTWLERMITTYPGFTSLMITDATGYELGHGGSHAYDLPTDTFTRLYNMQALLKMHIPGSKHNVDLLRTSGIRYVILFRDLRDVAVSYVFYVQQTRWHPEHPCYVGLSVQEGLALFGRTLLKEYEQWVRIWEMRRDPEQSILIQYEQMLLDTESVLTQVAQLFQLDDSPKRIEQIVEENRFRRLSGGRSKGEIDNNSFYRKGTAGDWKNHFTPELKEMYKIIIGEFLIDYGYETDLNW